MLGRNELWKEAEVQFKGDDRNRAAGEAVRAIAESVKEQLILPVNGAGKFSEIDDQLKVLGASLGLAGDVLGLDGKGNVGGKILWVLVRDEHGGRDRDRETYFCDGVGCGGEIVGRVEHGGDRDAHLARGRMAVGDRGLEHDGADDLER